MINFYQFLSGIIMLGAWGGGTYFLKLWTRSKERLYLIFAISFWLMAIERIVLAFTHGAGSEEHSYVYVIRLFAFLLILYAIVENNLAERQKHDRNVDSAEPR